MERVIKEGTLRLLTTESSCDVILSCQGRRLMAHKLILCMASSVFRDLLMEDSTDTTVVILPDISSHTMSLILDYVYTGNVVVHSNNIQSFLSLATLLKIQLDLEQQHTKLPEETCLTKFEEDVTNVSQGDKLKETDRVLESGNIFSSKTQKKLPQLIPIHKVRCLEKTRNNKTINRYNNSVLPSPWRSRIETVFGDPRDDILEKSEVLISKNLQATKLYENDKNNNSQLPVVSRYYYQLKDTVTKSPERYCHGNSPLLTSFHSKINQNRNSSNFIFNTTISRPPEEVAVDRDKTTDAQEDKSQKTKKWKTRDIKKFEHSDSSTTKLFSPNLGEVLHESSVIIKEDSDSSYQDNECIYPSAVKTEVKCNISEIELNSDNVKPYKCKDCGKCFSQMRNFKYHRSVHEGTKEFAAKCLECGKIFNDKGYLSSHMKIHRDKKEYACPNCPKRFNQRVAYNMHIRIHTGIKPHECSTCGKSFSRKMLLKQHQRVHTGERPYSCPECGKTFADRSNMSLHARLHTGVKPYACNLCPKSFTKKHHLKTHMNYHTGLKPYTCENCGLAFSQSSNMRTHFKKCLQKRQLSDNENDSTVDDEEKRNP